MAGSAKQKRTSKRDYATVIGRSHLTGYSGWPPPEHIREHLEIFVNFINNNLVEGSILDLGCGDGSIDRILAELSPKRKITAVDLEPHEQWKVKPPKNLAFKAASIYKLPFKEKSFDIVIMKDVLHHMPDPDKILRKVAKLAKKQVLIIEANRYNPVSFIRMVKIAGHEHFSQRSLKKIVGKPASLHTTETHVWPSSLRGVGRVHDVVLNKTPGLKNLRNYNFIIFEP